MLGQDAARQGELAAELPVPQLADQDAVRGGTAVLARPVVAGRGAGVVPLATDDQLAALDLDGDVALDVDPGELDPDDDVLAVAHDLDRRHEAGDRCAAGRTSPAPAAPHELVELAVHPRQHREGITLPLHGVLLHSALLR